MIKSHCRPSYDRLKNIYIIYISGFILCDESRLGALSSVLGPRNQLLRELTYGQEPSEEEFL